MDRIERPIKHNLTMINRAGSDDSSMSRVDPARVALIARALSGTGLVLLLKGWIRVAQNAGGPIYFDVHAGFEALPLEHGSVV
ncbi:hypothetical protein J6524_34890 [Bradyrhizobium sp. WSM 1738]|uniref:hypothetical protein n=1 Tax=Bradyrhizobium hereditatis TaxID=2821405 RepID=UPI001CE268B6|nr:hypothetical protein [Bradyrhizobium hereditatis]MCA6120007.1 hypothetical protein [Bradyrhizobium hereditatis]